MDLTKAEDIKKRWQEHTEELYKKGFNDPNGVVSHLEPDILECGIKWALGSTILNKASGGDGIPAELFKILKDDAVKVLQSICCHILEKSVFIPVQKKGNAKECSNCHAIALISHASKVMLRSFKLGFNRL